MSGAIPRPGRCAGCELDDTPPDHWEWMKDDRYTAGGRWRCLVKKRKRNAAYRTRLRNDPVRGPELREYERKYAKDHARWVRYKAYRHIDNRRYGGGTVPWEQADVLMGAPCHYCGAAPSEGLDRLDSSHGHTQDNVVPCCSVCNMILGDLPQGVKDELAGGLRRAREKGLLDTWTPPQLRARASRSAQRAG